MEKVRAAQHALGSDHNLALDLLVAYAKRDAPTGTERYHEMRDAQAWPQARALALRLVRSFTERGEPWRVACADAVIARIHAVEGEHDLAATGWSESVRHHLDAHAAAAQRWREMSDGAAATVIEKYHAWQQETGADNPRRFRTVETEQSRAIRSELRSLLTDCDEVCVDSVLRGSPQCTPAELKRNVVCHSASLLHESIENFLIAIDTSRPGFRSIRPLNKSCREMLLRLWTELPAMRDAQDHRATAASMARIARILSLQPQTPAAALRYMRQAVRWERIAAERCDAVGF